MLRRMVPKMPQLGRAPKIPRRRVSLPMPPQQKVAKMGAHLVVQMRPQHLQAKISLVLQVGQASLARMVLRVSLQLALQALLQTQW